MPRIGPLVQRHYARSAGRITAFPTTSRISVAICDLLERALGPRSRWPGAGSPAATGLRRNSTAPADRARRSSSSLARPVMNTIGIRDAALDQVALDVQAVHPGHAHVEQQACGAFGRCRSSGTPGPSRTPACDSRRSGSAGPSTAARRRRRRRSRRAEPAPAPAHRRRRCSSSAPSPCAHSRRARHPSSSWLLVQRPTCPRGQARAAPARPRRAAPPCARGPRATRPPSSS